MADVSTVQAFDYALNDMNFTNIEYYLEQHPELTLHVSTEVTFTRILAIP